MPGRQPPPSWLITAEHASNRVPGRWQALFAGDPLVLDSHRAWDPGTGELARALAGTLNAPLLMGRITRLLVDLNRSASHPGLFSEFSRTLPTAGRKALLDAYWTPYWQSYRRHVESLPPPVIHLACHSFVPVLEGRVRETDFGLLYDPARQLEKRWCDSLADAIVSRLPGLRVRRNFPYRGTANGLGQQHRRCFDAGRLVTVEIEFNQALLARKDWLAIRSGLVASIAATVE